MSWFFRLLASPIILFGTLVFEVLLAMTMYIYLAINHVETFGEMVRAARDVLNFIIDQMDAMLPGLSTQAHATLVGEIGPKSFLLLVLGLFASGVMRLVAWLIGRARVRIAAYRGV